MAASRARLGEARSGWRNGDRITAPLSDSHSLFINIHFTMTLLYPITKSNMIKNQFVTSLAVDVSMTDSKWAQ